KRKSFGGVGEIRADDAQACQAMWGGGTGSPAARGVARPPRVATPPPRRRAAWLRIFVVRCSLPCDPPVGGHLCNGAMIPSPRVGPEMLLQIDGGWVVDFFKSKPPSGRDGGPVKVPVLTSRTSSLFALPRNPSPLSTLGVDDHRGDVGPRCTASGSSSRQEV